MEELGFRSERAARPDQARAGTRLRPAQVSGIVQSELDEGPAEITSSDSDIFAACLKLVHRAASSDYSILQQPSSESRWHVSWALIAIGWTLSFPFFPIAAAVVLFVAKTTNFKFPTFRWPPTSPNPARSAGRLPDSIQIQSILKQDNESPATPSSESSLVKQFSGSSQTPSSGSNLASS
ncbi:hypothetical protein BCR37DRAFT_388433 [Protomyces lactucae-debilis]|uniref:Uncharacterized protein n=1 Tax=Protomyces lactucae-debilis TaxID=2754530 RepID=A0A1Y2F930_PROLT|nr:uncharacterized protein BCR37DRAFT_388433 [Protomyces lactucae-debilis]ORY79405.1 hypothetical protein BCR37DRAFT_388433 [Protomyces lactucae-debilis]